mmetsp:Transcript_12942/g.19506  ORF Transcript_12942/g.19506 Transcript_12942/m.19506 type:complete len:263 (+) Transcript_12942:50-838(+)
MGFEFLTNFIVNSWLSCLIILCCITIFACIHIFKIPVELLTFNYDKIKEDGEYWRIVSSTFSHTSILHIAFNMFSVFSYAFLEKQIGWWHYAVVTFQLMILSNAMQFYIYHIAVSYFNLEFVHQIHALGYSGVIFGLVSYASLLKPSAKVLFFNLIPIPLWLTPYASLLIVQFIYPRASFIGHLAGIFASYPIATGVIDIIFTTYWMASCMILFTLLITINIIYHFPTAYCKIELLQEGMNPFFELPQEAVVESDDESVVSV